MHIVTMSEFELGSPMAHAINVVKTSGGFVRLGHRVTLLCRRPASGPTDPRVLLADYAEPELNVEYVPDRVTADADAEARRAADWGANRAVALGADMVYARHFWGGLAAARVGVPTVIETHAHVGDAREPLAASARGAAGPLPLAIVTIAQVLKDWYVQLGADCDRVHVVPDGVDLNLFARPALLPPSPLSPTTAKISALYSGHLYDYKGIPTILDAAAIAPDVAFHLLGGTREDAARVGAQIRSRGLTNVILYGRRPHCAVPAYLWHADVLLLPPSARHPSAAWTSPVKLAEYLASETPIVCTMLASLRT